MVMPPITPTTSNDTLNTFINKVEIQIITPLVTLLALAAFVLFVWGVIEYIRNAANDEKRQTGQMHILYGIIGLVLIFGATAIVAILKNFAQGALS
jgi:uncharacterized membrane protein YidH (DUF202 family)